MTGQAGSGHSFDEVFRAEWIEILRTPWRALKANAYAERFIRTVRTECLDRVLLLGDRPLRSVLEAYVEHYNCERPHRGLDLVAPEGTKNVSPLTIDDSVRRRDHLGGPATYRRDASTSWSARRPRADARPSRVMNCTSRSRAASAEGVKPCLPATSQWPRTTGRSIESWCTRRS
jgi:hypothetical protein